MTSPTSPRELTVGVGAGGLATADMVLNIGPQHPATHGVLRLRIWSDGERIVSAEPIVGYMHRGAEKLFEVRDYRQIIVLANRHDWLSAFSNELGVVLGVEPLLGMEVPERAVWARTLLAELNRVLNHLMFLGSYPLELGAITPIFYSFREREELQAVMEEASGGRMHYMFNRVGGLKEDLPGRLARPGRARPSRAVRRRLPDLESADRRQRDPARPHPRRRRAAAARWSRRTASPGRSPAPPGSTWTCGATSPTWPTPSCSTDGPGRVVTRTAGDCLARLEVLLEQTHVCSTWPRLPRPARRLPQGRSTCGCPRCCGCPRATSTPGPRTRSASTATTWSRAGDKTPWRLKLRSASFNNVSVLAEAAAGQPDRRHGRDPRLDVLRRRRHRQVAGAPRAPRPRSGGVSCVALLLDLALAAPVEPGPPPHADSSRIASTPTTAAVTVPSLRTDMASGTTSSAASASATGRCERGLIIEGPRRCRGRPRGRGRARRRCRRGGTSPARAGRPRSSARR